MYLSVLLPPFEYTTFQHSTVALRLSQLQAYQSPMLQESSRTPTTQKTPKHESHTVPITAALTEPLGSADSKGIKPTASPQNHYTGCVCVCVCEKTETWRKKETKISTNQTKSSMKRRKLNSQIKNLFLIGTRCLESWRGYKVLRRFRPLCGGPDGP